MVKQKATLNEAELGSGARSKKAKLDLGAKAAQPAAANTAPAVGASGSTQDEDLKRFYKAWVWKREHRWGLCTWGHVVLMRCGGLTMPVSPAPMQPSCVSYGCCLPWASSICHIGGSMGPSNPNSLRALPCLCTQARQGPVPEALHPHHGQGTWRSDRGTGNRSSSRGFGRACRRGGSRSGISGRRSCDPEDQAGQVQGPGLCLHRYVGGALVGVGGA